MFETAELGLDYCYRTIKKRKLFLVEMVAQIRISKIAWLRGTSRVLKADVLESLQLRTYAASALVHRHGDVPVQHRMAIGGLLSGTLRMELATDNEGGYTVGMLREGAWFGAADFIQQRSRLMTIRASTDVAIAAIGTTDFKRLLKKHPTLSVSLAHIMAGNVEIMLDRISALTTRSSIERLYRVLINMSGQISTAGTIQPAVVDASQDEIAVAANLTSRTIRKLLIALKESGRIDYGYRQVRLM